MKLKLQLINGENQLAIFNDMTLKGFKDIIKHNPYKLIDDQNMKKLI